MTKIKKIVTLLIIVGIIIGVMKIRFGKIVQKSVSPNKMVEIVLVDNYFIGKIPGAVDRNFQIKLRKASWFGSYEEVFVSPDENIFGQERFIWSKDSTKFLLVAQNLIIVSDNKKSIQLNTGEYLYFFYDLPSNRKWCNCSSSMDTPFTFKDISNIEFEEPLHFPNASP